jgi:hypothetical protein
LTSSVATFNASSPAAAKRRNSTAKFCPSINPNRFNSSKNAPSWGTSAQAHVRFTPNSDRKSGHRRTVMSALPPKADMCSAKANVCFGPIRTFVPFTLTRLRFVRLRTPLAISSQIVRMLAVKKPSAQMRCGV